MGKTTPNEMYVFAVVHCIWYMYMCIATCALLIHNTIYPGTSSAVHQNLNVCAQLCVPLVSYHSIGLCTGVYC